MSNPKECPNISLKYASPLIFEIATITSLGVSVDLSVIGICSRGIGE
jgi:hypothetical protein